jgi:hypothetical protein
MSKVLRPLQPPTIPGAQLTDGPPRANDSGKHVTRGGAVSGSLLTIPNYTRYGEGTVRTSHVMYPIHDRIRSHSG